MIKGKYSVKNFRNFFSVLIKQVRMTLMTIMMIIIIMMIKHGNNINKFEIKKKTFTNIFSLFGG